VDGKPITQTKESAGFSHQPFFTSSYSSLVKIGLFFLSFRNQNQASNGRLEIKLDD
jgi:hypothetical protein